MSASRRILWAFVILLGIIVVFVIPSQLVASSFAAPDPPTPPFPTAPEITRGENVMESSGIPNDVYDARDAGQEKNQNAGKKEETLTPHTGIADSKGVDFWLAFPGNYTGDTSLSLFVTSDVNTSGRVEIPGLSYSKSFSVTGGHVTTISLPTRANINTSDRVENLGIHVTANQEVTVYGLNQKRYTTDAYLGLPTDILGKEYINLTYPVSLYGSGSTKLPGSRLTIIASKNDTRITIIPSVNAGGRSAHTAYTISLNQGQTYQLSAEYASGDDLSGTQISADKPIAVFGSHRCTVIPTHKTACDHIVEQLFPISTWGQNFVTMPLATRKNGDTFRILASTDGTTVKLNGATIVTLNRGQVYERVISGPAQITADKPILVAQYSNSSSYDNVTSDPFMMLVPPYEQFLGNYTVTTPSSGIRANYINIVAPNAAVGHITLDGSIIPANRFVAIGSSGFSGVQVAVGKGSHSLSGSHPFGVFVYGFDDYDSYGYPGGLSLGHVATVAHLSLEPQHATNRINTQHCVTATATDQYSNPIKDIRIDFIVNGVHQKSGFAFTDGNGQARFCYTGVNWGEDTITASTGSLSATATKTWGFSPSGYLGRAACDAITGWAGDKDDPLQPIEVHFYADGPYGTGTFIGSMTADKIREAAVCEALDGANCGVCPADQPQCKHGFEFTNIPAWLKDNHSHEIYVYGINLPNTGGNGAMLINGSPKTLNCQAMPTPTPFPGQPTPTPALPTPTATPDFPTCHLNIDKTAYPATARKDGQVGVTLKLEGDCPSEIGAALDVTLVIDRSSSMCGDKLNQAQAAGQTFFDNMAFPPDQAAVVSFANTALLHAGLTGNRTQAQNALYNITCGGFSRIDAGLNKAYEEMSGPRRVAGHTPAIILLTDGNPEGAYADDVRAAAQQIKDAGIQLFSIGLGNDVNAALLREIATQPEYYYQSPTADQLQAIYTRLASELRTVPAMNVDITDVIDSHFELVPDSFSGPATPAVYGDTLRWHLPRLESGVTELSFNIKPKSCGTFPTNQSAAVSYDDNRGQRQTRTFPNPQVTIEGCGQHPPDVFVRDNPSDDGSIPSQSPWWISPDIWVRRNNDGGTQHQNPQAGQRNYIYVRIWNTGNLPVHDIDVQMYYANPSLGLSYPDNWTAIGGPVRVDVVAERDHAIAIIPWDTPNITGHFCLFVRISSSEDAIRDDRTQWENNIAQRNMHIIDYPQPPDGSCQFDENNLLTDRIAFDVVNTQATSSMVDLQISVSSLGANAQVRFEPGPLSGRWTSLDGLVQESDGRLLVTHFPATIYGVRLNPHELRTVHIEVKAPANSRFTVGLIELVRGKVVGGNSYQRVLPPCPIFLPVIIQPGPVVPTPTPLPACAQGGKVDVVFAMDTSGSMYDEFGALCHQIDAIVANLQNQGVSVNYRILGLARTFQCASDTVQHLVPGGLVNHEEDWGPAVTDLSNGYAWQPDYARLIIPMSDEGPENGDPVHDPGNDRDAITAAIAAAQAHQVIVSPILGTGHSGAVTRLAQDLANATGGRVFQSTEPAQDIAGAIGDMIGLAACMPVVESVEPPCGIDANTLLTVHGRHFAANATAQIGSLPARDVIVISSTEMQMKIDPSLSDGVYDLSITNPPPPDGMTYTLPNAVRVGTCATATPTITPTPTATRTPTPTFTPTPTATPNPFFLWWMEAENAVITQPMGIGQSSQASQCKFVYTTDDWSTGNVSMSFTTPASGNYYLWGRAQGLGWKRNSFFVSIDNGPRFHWEIVPIDDQWKMGWQIIVEADHTPGPFWLSAGTHNLRFQSREGDARLDMVLITDDEQYQPDVEVPCGAATPTPGPGSTWTNPKDGMEYVFVPAGDFTMGTASNDPDAKYGETPQHQVFLDAYWLAKYEVTNSQYAQFLNEKGNQIEGGVAWFDADSAQAKIVYQNGVWQAKSGWEKHPVTGVSWYGARAYATWSGVRLPTEAEWEKGARGADARTFPWGNAEPDCARLNFFHNGNPCVGATTIVGNYPSGVSPYGALDMAGNVWEWASDWYDPGYYSASPAQNPTGPATGTKRVLRGGSWEHDRSFVRTSFRTGYTPDFRYYNTGFRPARSP